MGSTDVLIAGAGPTGLTAAIECRRLGIPFRLIDKAEHPARYSQALVVQARTLEQFERYGIAQIAVDQGRKLHQASMISEGKTIVSFPLDKIPGRYPFVLFLPQNQTEQLLTEHLRSLGGGVERGTELIEVARTEQSVTATLRRKDGTSEEISARWLIGCDGAHSTVRQAFDIPFSGEAVALNFYLGDLELEGPDQLGDELRVYLHRGDIVFIGRLTEKLNRVIVALHSSQEHGGEPKELTLEDFQGPLDRAGIRLKVLSAVWMTPFHVNDRQAEQIAIGNVFLVGDASHIHSPVGGQGMNTGIQDVANLVWKIAAVRSGAPVALLASYEEERGVVGEALLRNTSRVLTAASAHNRFFESLRDLVASTASRFGFVQKQILGFVSETDISYRDSSVVVDCGGGGSLRAGDRVPNPEIHFANGATEPLLTRLGEARQLLISVDTEESFTMADSTGLWRTLTLRRAELTEESQAELAALFGSEARLLVVRPDGYLGFRGTPRHRLELEKYCHLTGLATPPAY